MMHLRILSLANNQIDTIMPKAFWRNSSTPTRKDLRRLDLSNNELQFVKANTFYPLLNLRQLDLSSNKLKLTDGKLILKLSQHLNQLQNNEVDLTNQKLDVLPPTISKHKFADVIEALDYLKSKNGKKFTNILYNNINFELESNEMNLFMAEDVKDRCTCVEMMYLTYEGGDATICNNYKNMTRICDKKIKDLAENIKNGNLSGIFCLI